MDERDRVKRTITASGRRPTFERLVEREWQETIKCFCKNRFKPTLFSLREGKTTDFHSPSKVHCRLVAFQTTRNQYSNSASACACLSNVECLLLCIVRELLSFDFSAVHYNNRGRSLVLQQKRGHVYQNPQKTSAKTCAIGSNCVRGPFASCEGPPIALRICL